MEENIEETQDENQDSLNTDLELDQEDEGSDNQEASTDEDAEAIKESLTKAQAKVAELEAKNRELFARAKRAGSKPKESITNKPADNIDVIEFFSKGNTKEDYNKLQVIMRGSGLSMEEAQKDPLYQSYKEKKDRELRDEKAQIAGSKSSTAKNDNSFKAGMTEEEHKQAWAKLK